VEPAIWGLIDLSSLWKREAGRDLGSSSLSNADRKLGWGIRAGSEE
jgi:hypothetical protein